MKTTSKKWTPLFLTQALGILNDNLLKGAICFISVSWVAPDQQPTVLALASALLVIPFLLASPWAGRLSMRFQKTRVVNLAKLAELGIMMIAVAGFLMENIYLAMIALVLMGLQSAVYAPSKYGLIKDIGGKEGINFGTGMMELFTFVSILLGLVIAGFLADLGALQKPLLGGAFFVLAMAGWWASNRIRVEELEPVPDYEDTINPARFLKKTWKESAATKGLRWVLIGLGAFWLIASMIQLNLLLHLPEEYGLNATTTAIVLSAVAVGVGLGCWVAGIIVRSRIELGMITVGGFGMSICLTVVGFADLSLFGFIAFTFAGAFFSGWFKVPLNAWIQDKIKGRNLGRILALQNMIICLFVVLSAVIFKVATLFLDSAQIFGVIALIAWVTAIFTLLYIPELLIRFMVFVLSRVIFRVRIHGHENIPTEGGALVVANHVSYLDFMLLVATVPRQLRFVMLKDMYDKKALKWLLKRLNMIPINARHGANNLEEFNRLCQSEINAGNVVCIFAEGTVTRTGQMLEFKKGVEHIAKGIDAPIIPIHLGDVIGTPFSWQVGKSKMVLPRFSTLGKEVQVSVGDPMLPSVTAFEIRQRIMELEADSFGYNTLGHRTLGKAIFYNLKRGEFSLSNGMSSMDQQELLRSSIALANQIGDGLRKIECVAVMLPTTLQTVALQCALQFLGKTVVGLKPSYTPEERQLIMRKSNARVLITTKDLSYTRFVPFAPQVMYVEDIPARRSWINRALDRLDADWFGFRQFEGGQPDSDKPATIIFEPHKKGEFKAIPLSHQNVLAQLKALQQVFGTVREKRVLSDFDPCSAFGFILEFAYPLVEGFDHDLKSNSDLIEAYSKMKPHVFLGTVDELKLLINSGVSLENLEFAHTEKGELHINELEALQAAGVQWMMSAGLNESCSVFSVNVPGYNGLDIAGKTMKQTGNRAGSVGRPLPGVAVRIANPDNLEEVLAPGQVGKVLVKGATVVRGYFDQCYSWSKNFYRDWFITPLEGYLDEKGFLVIV